MVVQPKNFPLSSLESLKSKLTQMKPALERKYQVTQLGIFGSYARGEQTEDSDIDILIAFEPDVKFGMVTFCTIADQLTDALGKTVDLVMKDALKPNIGQRILEEVIYL